MKIAIVGHAEEKFNEMTKATAKRAIKEIIEKYKPCIVISGHSPMGGIDIWAEEEAEAQGQTMVIYEPMIRQWNPPGRYGFKARNIDIAKNCDVLYNIVVTEYPEGYEGRRDIDYHCMGRLPLHVKSGGCWTAWRAKGMGKEVHFIIIGGEEVVV